MTQPQLDPGIAIIHSNQLENLLAVVEYWLKQHPLAPLENELFLVQSNGMGQWLKQGLARNDALGIAAGLNLKLPSTFIWDVYRAVLGEQIPTEQTLAKAPLTWRLYRLLPELTKAAQFEVLAKFLAQDQDGRKRYQLAEQLADLFDQYQVYRSDWLTDWAAHNDSLCNALQVPSPLPETERWQAALWRAILADLGPDDTAFASRASVHRLFMQRIDQLSERPAALPRRILLFGLSSLPQQALEVFAKLGKLCQIVLFVPNPCRYYWADIIEDKELLRTEQRRQATKSGMPTLLTDNDLHLHSQPLLAAWGKQGRDYIRLLDAFDERQRYQHWHWPEQKIDVFSDYGETGQRSLLQALQQDILDLEPLPATPKLLSAVDASIVFHIAHSPQREMEILHDQMLARLAETRNHAQPLTPRDILVMVPDINQYAPHIRAVFGLFAPNDPRYIPFSIADQRQRGQNPLLIGLEVLLTLPESRFTVSEFLGLLEIPALRARFEIDEGAIAKIHQWIKESGIRWGFNAEQRSRRVKDMPSFDSNTWQFGLRRMLLGYAVGAGCAYREIEPYAEIGGLDAQWLGGLALLMETLDRYADLLQPSRSSQAWHERLLLLLADFFNASNDAEQKILTTLTKALEKWSAQCLLAGLTASEQIPLTVVREAWLDGMDQPSLHQNFLNGRVNFCTLMPMRAIPFRVVCLLGMNDGDYPRTQAARSFDLMSQRGQYRPGDRSRRQDDHYLFLEAVLSARQQLYISWVGRSIRDNSQRPPSVLISQLREVLNQNWCLADQKTVLGALTVEHPLQPFSLDYIQPDRDPRLFTYAQEWFSESSETSQHSTAPASPPSTVLIFSIDSIARFLKAPVKTFCQQSLKLTFETDDPTSEDTEVFGFDHLQRYHMTETLLQDLLHRASDLAADAFIETQRTTLINQGRLPLGGFASASFDQLMAPVTQTFAQYQTIITSYPVVLPSKAIQMPMHLPDSSEILIIGDISQLRAKTQEETDKILLTVTAQSLKEKVKGKDRIRYDKLLKTWVQHLVASAANLEITTYLIAADGILTIDPLPSSSATTLLNDLAEAYVLGLQAPLPVACKTAFAWLLADEQEDAEDQARARYEGSDQHPGEVYYDPYLQRFFPDFEQLYSAVDTENFSTWALRLYHAIIEHIKPLSAEDASA